MSVPDDSAADAKQQLNLEGGEELIKQALAELGLFIDDDLETRSQKVLSRKKLAPRRI